MNVEKLNKIIKKYKSNYYHNTSIYERQYDDIPNQIFNCDHIELIYQESARKTPLLNLV